MLHLRYPKPKPTLGLMAWNCRECHKRLDPEVLALVVLQGGEVNYQNRELWFHPKCVMRCLGWTDDMVAAAVLAGVTQAVSEVSV